MFGLATAAGKPRQLEQVTERDIFAAQFKTYRLHHPAFRMAPKPAVYDSA